jgi:hypothetical protein
MQDDLEELLRRVEEIQADDLLQLRLRKLSPPPAEEQAAEETAGEDAPSDAAVAGDAPAGVHL